MIESVFGCDFLPSDNKQGWQCRYRKLADAEGLTAVASFLNIFNPEVVVICGGVTQAGDKLFNPLRSEVKRRAFKPAWEACKIVPGTLPGTAGVYGAAGVFIQKHWGLR